ncbi:MAG: 16S rRNA (guanine(966)-N(2))-methyltransferase RsmD [bacterium]
MIRIISGTKKNLQLAVAPNVTRPLTDRIKASIFDLIREFIPNNFVLDIFAGSGAFGLECLSRGALHADFVENDATAIQIIFQNIQKAKFQLSSNVYETNAEQFLKSTKNRYRLVFLDPPFNLLEKSSYLPLVAKIIEPNALVILRIPVKENWEDPRALALTQVYQKKYGESLVAFYRN